jgi:hypothetical protein
MQGSLALSLRVPPSIQADSIAHYIILHTEEGYKIKVSWDKGMIKVSSCICRGTWPSPSGSRPPSSPTALPTTSYSTGIQDQGIIRVSWERGKIKVRWDIGMIRASWKEAKNMVSWKIGMSRASWKEAKNMVSWKIGMSRTSWKER